VPVSTPAAAPTDNGPLDVTALIEKLLHDGEPNIYDKVVLAVERILLSRTLAKTKGHIGQSSELLGLNRTTMRRKLRMLGLTIDKTVQEG
jgi:two-component system nitrogen regulation response regulator GlnG